MGRSFHRFLALATLTPLLCGISCAAEDESTSPADASSGQPADHGQPTDGADGSCPPRWIFEGEALNARDLGGHPLGDGAAFKCGVLYRGGDLTSLTEPVGCAELTGLGIKTVLDLRMETEQEASPNAACVQDATVTVSAPLPKILPDTPEHYIDLLDAQASWKTFFTTLADPAQYPIYTHCVIGRDRASIAAGMVLQLAGADRQTIIDEFLLSEQAATPIAVRRESLEALLDELERRGGVEAYLTTEVGLTAAQLSSVRSLVSSAD